MNTCKPSKRLRNWHRTLSNAGMSLKVFARLLLVDSSGFEQAVGKAARSTAPIAKRWLASKRAP